MSFDLFLQCVREHEPATFPRAIVEDAFGRFASSRDTGRWVLDFPDGGQSFLYLDEEAEIDGFNVNRPASSPELWQGLLDILRQTTSVLFWPDGGAVVAAASVIPHVPAFMIDGLGQPIIVTAPAQIVEAIEKS